MTKGESKSNIKICLSCSRSISSSDLASMQCGHQFHYQCLQVLLGDSIDRELYPTVCPVTGCQAEPSLYFMSVVLEDDYFSKYIALETDKAPSFQNFDCSSCDQSFLAYLSSNTHKCLRCQKVTCLNCLSPAHPKRECSQISSVGDQLPVLRKIAHSPNDDSSSKNNSSLTKEISRRSRNIAMLQTQSPFVKKQDSNPDSLVTSSTTTHTRDTTAEMPAVLENNRSQKINEFQSRSSSSKHNNIQPSVVSPLINPSSSRHPSALFINPHVSVKSIDQGYQGKAQYILRPFKQRPSGSDDLKSFNDLVKIDQTKNDPRNHSLIKQ